MAAGFQKVKKAVVPQVGIQNAPKFHLRERPDFPH
jgi:hypothetical protein